MSSQILTVVNNDWKVRPCIPNDLLREILNKQFGLLTDEQSIKELISYDDRNFNIKAHRINDPDEISDEFIVKIYNFSESKNITWYQQILNNVTKIHQQCSKHFEIPLPIVDKQTEKVCCFCEIPIKADATFSNCSQEELLQDEYVTRHDSYTYLKHIIRVTKFILGSVLDVKEMDEKLAYSYGKSAGLLIKALKDLPVPKLDVREDWIWNLLYASKVLLNPYVSSLSDENIKQQFSSVLKHFDEHTHPKLSKLSRQWAHGDFIDQNVLHANNRVVGFIDFDDSCYSYGVVDIATVLVCISFMSSQEKCIENMRIVFTGIQSVIQLDDIEMNVLYNLTLVRYVQTISISEYQYKFLDPGNEYLLYGCKEKIRGFDLLYSMGEAKFLAAIRLVDSANPIQKQNVD